MTKIVTYLGVIVDLIVAAAGLAILMAFPVKWLVNDVLNPQLVSGIFGTPAIDVWQALKLSYLCSLLFKGSSATVSGDKS